MSMEILEVAFEKYGECLGSSSCKELVSKWLVEKYGISKSEAEEYAQLALDRWVEVYCE